VSSPPNLPEKLRVVFTGHAGTLKSEVLRRFSQFVESQLSALGVRRSVKWAEAEKKLKPMPVFLQRERPGQEYRFLDSIRAAINDVRDADYAFLSLHLSYRSYSRFFSPLSWRRLSSSASDDNADTLIKMIADEFTPDYCVCIIDDIQSAQQRIAHGPGGIHLRLAELLAWRNIETLLTDLFAQQVLRESRISLTATEFPFERSPVFSNRHDPATLFRYLFQPDCLRVYASYPITRTRGHPARRHEIDDFRRTLNECFCVFDPVTIDELPLESLLTTKSKRKELVLPASARWPLDHENTLSGEQIIDIEGVRVEEINEILSHRVAGRTELDVAVEERDLRLVDQSDCVVVYRPQYSTGLRAGTKKYHAPTEGTGAEINYALKTAGRPVYIVHDAAVDGDFRRGALARAIPIGPEYYIEKRNLADERNRKSALRDVMERLRAHEAEFVGKRLNS
jgi:hypothetical protein